MYELNLLLVIVVAMALSIGGTLHFFIKRAKKSGGDLFTAAKNGLLVSLLLFALFVVAFEELREKKPRPAGQDSWCDQHPAECRPGHPFIR